MKGSKFIVILVFLFHGILLTGQSLGIRAGAYFSTIIESSTIGEQTEVRASDSKIGWIAGLVEEFDLTKNLALESGLFYILKRGEWNGGSRIKWTYLQVPLHGKYYFHASRNFKPFLCAGPYLGFRWAVDETASFEYLFKQPDIGLNFGAGFHINKGFQLGIYYEYGLTKFSRSLDPIDDVGYQNRGFQIILTAYGT